MTLVEEDYTEESETDSETDSETEDENFENENFENENFTVEDFEIPAGERIREIDEIDNENRNFLNEITNFIRMDDIPDDNNFIINRFQNSVTPIS